MAITEKDVYAALGMDPSQQPEVADPAGQGEKAPAVTEPAGAEERTAGERISPLASLGRNDREGAGNREQGTGGTDPSSATQGTGPQGEGFAEEESTEQTADAEDGQTEAGKETASGMSKAERARQAKLRREREQNEAVKNAVEAALRSEREKHAAELKTVFERAGMTDRYHDNKPITTMEEFNAWDQAGQAAGLSRRLQEGKLTAEDFQKAVDSSPAMQEAKAAVEQIREREREAQRKEYEQTVSQELEEIRKLDPSVKDLQDILNRDTGAEFSRLVTENNLTFLQAFRLANADSLAKAQAMAAAEGSARNSAGKNHLRSVVGPAAGLTADVPPQTMRLYRDMFPDWTPEQIRQDYARKTKG